MPEVPIQRDYATDPSLFPRVAGLLGRVFSFFPDQHEAAVRIGLDWQAVSTPFVVSDGGPGGAVLAHVGVLDLPLVVEEKPVRAAGIHAVATHPSHRRRGLYGRVMQAALRHVDKHYDVALLSTDRPELYEGFGFRAVRECRYVGAAPPPGPGVASRPLDYSDPADVRLLHEHLTTRQPVSSRFGLAGESAVFLFNQAKAPPTYVPMLDALLVGEVEDAVLRLYDVVARKMPTLSRILAAVPEPIERVEVYFEPRALKTDLEPERHLLGGDDHLCVRGPLACEGHPFMWPRPARC